jgi:CDGSH-type Zn-finger protein
MPDELIEHRNGNGNADGSGAGTGNGNGAHDRAVITPYRDGPLLVRGPFTLQDMHGEEIEVRRETVALCRCGRSRMRPFCDGSHKLVRFRAPSGLEDRGRPEVPAPDPDSTRPA